MADSVGHPGKLPHEASSSAGERAAVAGARGGGRGSGRSGGGGWAALVLQGGACRETERERVRGREPSRAGAVRGRPSGRSWKAERRSGERKRSGCGRTFEYAGCK